MQRFNIANKDLPFLERYVSLAFRQLGLIREIVISHSDILDLIEKLNISFNGSYYAPTIGHLFATDRT